MQDNHRFQVGQSVTLSVQRYRAGRTDEYKIMRLLPFEDGQYQYRIKSATENHERVAAEDQLTLRRADGP